MWTLALGGIFLAAVEACVFCRFPDRELSGRLARLCSQMEVQWKDCEVSWTFSAFALDDASLNKITEKTHRVLRVMEIKGSLYSLPSYWQWLRKTKLREYNREALCPPSCREGQHHPVQLFNLPGLRGVLLAPKALLPRKSRSLGSSDPAPLCVRNCPAPGCPEPRGGVSWGIRAGDSLTTSHQYPLILPPALVALPSSLPRPPTLCFPSGTTTSKQKVDL
ncbi:sperm-egg fusion protein TMEM95 isoform X3 [Bos indicus]|uniref:Sperm-egg fusion protein TMEM95 isoform X3 n=1 Tax=Bos indicus TaxID=9915 RepID=A0ABM4R0K6_BOSIN|nr:sperm-egg fusion protein TMEM95 isoform X3 [Bos taurus]XP_061245666.1 sperm-egg fusion protein TMEM95 isoform X3 [Bos javanicus]